MVNNILKKLDEAINMEKQLESIYNEIYSLINNYHRHHLVKLRNEEIDTEIQLMLDTIRSLGDGKPRLMPVLYSVKHSLLGINKLKEELDGK